jgi:hypothetical protein
MDLLGISKVKIVFWKLKYAYTIAFALGYLLAGS